MHWQLFLRYGGFKGGGAVGLTADDWKTKAFLK